VFRIFGDPFPLRGELRVAEKKGEPIRIKIREGTLGDRPPRFAKSSLELLLEFEDVRILGNRDFSDNLVFVFLEDAWADNTLIHNASRV